MFKGIAKTMMSIITLLMVFTSLALAASPQLINYHGRLTNASDVPLNGVFTMVFTIWSEPADGISYWSEIQSVTVSNGLFSVALGSITNLPGGTFLSSDTSVYLGIKVGTDPEIAPRTRLIASPYARQVETLQGASGGGVTSGITVTSTGGFGLSASANSPFVSTNGVYGAFTAVGNIDGVGVRGYSEPADFYGYGGAFQGGYAGAHGSASGPGGFSYFGLIGNASTSSLTGGTTYGLYGAAINSGAGTTYGVFGSASNGAVNYAGYFQGPVTVSGFLSKLGGGFRIDHPLDPANKYLQHSFVESPDMKNFYDGVVTLDGHGEATVRLPEWFDQVNEDFRYQLTCVGGYAPVYIAKECANNQFTIAGGKSGLKVSWAVTGIRKDVWAEENRMEVELKKPAQEIGKYLYPKGFGETDDFQIGAISKETKEKMEKARIKPSDSPQR